MKSKLILCLALVMSGGLFGCSSKDPIDWLVTSLTRHPPELDFYHFPNGNVNWDSITLPATASPAQLLAKLPNSGSFSLNATNFTILESRHVRIAYSYEDPRVFGPNYTAILVQTASGRKIVLAQFQGHTTNDVWLARIYEVD